MVPRSIRLGGASLLGLGFGRERGRDLGEREGGEDEILELLLTIYSSLSSGIYGSQLRPYRLNLEMNFVLKTR